MTLADRIRLLVKRVRYKHGSGWHVIEKDGVVLLQHYQHIACTQTGEDSEQKGRKFYISPHMTDEEVLRTCYLSVKLFEEHEINETFEVDGDRFLNPHPEGGRK